VRVAAAPAVTTTDVLALARELAARHNVRTEGFDTPGIGVDTVRELASAVDRMLDAYPFLALGGIEITDLGGAAVSRTEWDRPDADLGRGKQPPWLQLDRDAVRNPDEFSEKTSAAQRLDDATPNYTERVVYSAVIGEFGGIMTVAAGPRPLRAAQHFLITEYHRISGPWAGRDTLAQVVGGYRQWRAQLGTAGVAGDTFRPSKALVAAFTEVELHGKAACDPAKVLHRLLLESARQDSATR
jgi:hypothetical protein